MCLRQVILDKASARNNINIVNSKRDRKKISLIRDGGIGYKVFDCNRSSYYSSESYFSEDWKRAKNNILFDYYINRYTSGFHLFYNLSDAVAYGKRWNGIFYVSILEYKDVICIGYEYPEKLCIIANSVRLIRNRAYAFYPN